MTSKTDTDLIIAAWLSEGAEQAPDRRSRLALDEIATTPQRRPRAWPGSTDEPAANRLRLLAFMAATVVLAVTLGVAFRAGFIGVPSRSAIPVPSATATTSEADLETFVADDGSFEIRLPDVWRRDVGPDPSATYLRTATFELSIRAGDADGSLVTCDDGAGPWETCKRVTPTSLDELAEEVGLTSAEEGGAIPVGPVRSSTTLGGEPARVERIEAYEAPARGAESVTYITAMHEGRPYILRLWFPGADPGDVVLDVVVAGFQFLAADAAPSPPQIEQPEAVEGLRTFLDPNGSFEIRLPDDWSATVGEDSSALYLTRGALSMSIRAGDGGGEVRTCDRGAGGWETCESVVVADLEELDASIGLADDGQAFQGPLEWSITLDGEPATIHWIVTSTNGRLSAVQYVAAMHEGRPYVMRITGSQRFRETPYGMAVGFDSELLDGFSFLPVRAPSQSEGSNGFRTFTAADASFQIRLPEAWTLDRGPGRDTLYLANGTDRLLARAGDAEGKVLTCDEAQGPWEECLTSTPRTLTELGRDVTLQATSTSTDPTRSDATLGGETARIEAIEAAELPASGGQWVSYVIAMHEGRPFVIRLWSPGAPLDDDVAEVIDGFAFLDD
ncbi:MAG TPA: hypothetical protein VIH24_02935 [Candidatus Limnocylindria bacterium]